MQQNTTDVLEPGGRATCHLQTSGGTATTEPHTRQSESATKSTRARGQSLLPLVTQLLEQGASLRFVVNMIESHYCERIEILEKAVSERAVGAFEAHALQAVCTKERQRVAELEEELEMLSLRYRSVENSTTGADAAVVGATTSDPKKEHVSHMKSHSNRHAGASGPRASASIVNFSFAGAIEKRGSSALSTPSAAQQALRSPPAPPAGPARHRVSQGSGGDAPTTSHDDGSCSTPTEDRRAASPASLPKPGSIRKGESLQRLKRNPSAAAALSGEWQTADVASERLSLWELRTWNDNLQKQGDTLMKEVRTLRQFLQEGRSERRVLIEQNRRLHTACMAYEDEMAHHREVAEAAQRARDETEAGWEQDRAFYVKRVDELRAKLQLTRTECDSRIRAVNRSMHDASEGFQRDRQAWLEKEAAMTVLINNMRRRAQELEQGKLSDEMQVIKEELEPLRAALGEANARAEAAEAVLDPLKQQLHDLLHQSTDKMPRGAKGMDRSVAGKAVTRGRVPTPIVDADAFTLSIGGDISRTRGAQNACDVRGTPEMLPPLRLSQPRGGTSAVTSNVEVLPNSTTSVIPESGFDDILDEEACGAVQRRITALEKSLLFSPTQSERGGDEARAASRSFRESKLVDVKHDALFNLEKEMRRERRHPEHHVRVLARRAQRSLKAEHTNSQFQPTNETQLPVHLLEQLRGPTKRR